MRRLGERDDEDLTRGAARTLGAQLAALGFSMDFAPVLDVDTNPDNPVIGDRAFGRDPDGVIRHGLAFAAGLAEGGVDGCGKHFPGHGDTDLDSHLKLPRLSHARSRLDAVELKPFHAAARARLPAIMTAHVVFDALDPGVPATLSHRVVTGLLRGELRFEGAIVSDDLEMKAVSDAYAIDEAAVAAIDAGCDLLLVCSDLDACFAAHEALVRRAEGDAAFATRLQEAAQRSLRLRRARPPRPVAPAEVDAALAAAAGRAELERDLAALFQGPAEGR
jgi:beta-N-acetylhexosaminidase